MAYLGSDVGYGTLSPQSSRSEFVSFSGITQNTDGSATLTGVVRGLVRTTASGDCGVASTTLRQAHPGQSIFILSNSPCFYKEYPVKQNTEYITGAWGFQGTAPTSTICASANELCNKAYVDATANQGAATSTETNGGIVELATAEEAAASFDGGVSKPTVLQSKYATSTPTPSCSTFCVVIATAGKISQAFIDLTQTFAWAALHTFSAGFLSTASSTVDAEFTVTGTTTLSAGILTVSTTTATSTFAGNLQILKNATTTNLYVSDNCVGCSMTYTGSSTNFNVSSGAVTFTGSIPTKANTALCNYETVINTLTRRGNAHFTRSGMTVASLRDRTSGNSDAASYTLTWSGANFVVTETIDNNSNSSINGTCYWYR